MQRVQTSDLRKHLHRELETATAAIEKVHTDLEKYRIEIVDISDRIGLTKRDGDKLGMAAKSLNKSHQK